MSIIMGNEIPEGADFIPCHSGICFPEFLTYDPNKPILTTPNCSRKYDFSVCSKVII